VPSAIAPVMAQTERKRCMRISAVVVTGEDTLRTANVTLIRAGKILSIPAEATDFRLAWELFC
jgi:hypothetical protein